MSTSSSSADAGSGPRSVRRLHAPSAHEANEALRSFVRRRQDQPWTPVDLAELDRLRQVWGDAVRGDGAWGRGERGPGMPGQGVGGPGAPGQGAGGQGIRKAMIAAA